MADVINDIKSVGSTFTSWDSCMSKTYCKWPVIAGIIIGSLIVLSVLWCVFSCLCCGISLCAACGRCFTCFGCCGACNKSERRRKDPEYHPMPPTPTPYQGYQPHNNMTYNGGGPQFATFDTGNKRSANIHEDSLPTMPSWENAQTRRVEDRSQPPRGSDLEMERMLSNHGPASPIRDSPYQSDLGQQRLGQQYGAHTDYYDPPQPLSPAPTYYSSAPMATAMAHPQHERSMPQQEYHDNSYNGGYNANVAPYPSSRESTQFAASRGLSSPQGYESYRSTPYEQPHDVRPPSLLQVGRKPVANTYREV